MSKPLEIVLILKTFKGKEKRRKERKIIEKERNYKR